MSTGGSERMIVLHALAPARFGGLERVVETLASGQQRCGHTVHVAAIVDPGEEDHPFVASVRKRGVDAHAVPVARREYLAETRLVSDLCRRLRPDVVHTHGYRSDFVDARAARAQGIRTVSTVHGFTRNGWKNRAYEWLQRREYRSFDAVAAVSRAQVAELVGCGVAAERVHCVPNAWPGNESPLPRAAARQLLGLGDSDFVIGWVGRLGREKGADVLIDACRHLADTEHTVVSIVGDGQLRFALQRRAVAAGVAARIRWHGSVVGAGTLFSAFDLFVLSSRTEGTPMVLFEAMAAHVPIVATRVGGVPDVVRSDEAYLVPPDDAVALANAISTARSDAADAHRRAAAARRRLEDVYDAASWIERYTALYRTVLRSRNGREP